MRKIRLCVPLVQLQPRHKPSTGQKRNPPFVITSSLSLHKCSCPLIAQNNRLSLCRVYMEVKANTASTMYNTAQPLPVICSSPTSSRVKYFAQSAQPGGAKKPRQEENSRAPKSIVRYHLQPDTGAVHPDDLLLIRPKCNSVCT